MGREEIVGGDVFAMRCSEVDHVAGPPSPAAKSSVASYIWDLMMNVGILLYMCACVLAHACMECVWALHAGMDAPKASKGRCRSNTLMGTSHGVCKVTRGVFNV